MKKHINAKIKVDNHLKNPIFVHLKHLFTMKVQNHVNNVKKINHTLIQF